MSLTESGLSFKTSHLELPNNFHLILINENIPSSIKTNNSNNKNSQRMTKSFLKVQNIDSEYKESNLSSSIHKEVLLDRESCYDRNLLRC